MSIHEPVDEGLAEPEPSDGSAAAAAGSAEQPPGTTTTQPPVEPSPEPPVESSPANLVENLVENRVENVVEVEPDLDAPSPVFVPESRPAHAAGPVDGISVATGARPGPGLHAPSRIPLHVALIGEGAYPFQPGGVSLWCHQLVQGMTEHTFTAVTLSVTGRETSAWTAPRNLDSVVNIPIWGSAPRPTGRRSGRRGSPAPAPSGSFIDAYQTFLDVLLTPGHAVAHRLSQRVEAFLWSLRVMFEYAQAGRLADALASNPALDQLQHTWRAAGLDGDDPDALGPLSLREAITVTDQLEHMLRPLAYPPVRADVCHLSMNGLSSLIALTSNWTYGTPIVLSEHGVYLRERYLGLTGVGSYAVRVVVLRFFRALVSATYHVADVLAPHSQFNRRWMVYSGADPARIQTMYNGINPADFPEAQGEPDLPTIVFVGRIDPLKDLHTLIRAFALVREQLPQARLRMYGPVTATNQEYYTSCLRLVQQLGLIGAASFEGRIDRQVDAYQAGQLVALTSVSEGFPFTVVESMSVGRPQVCTNVGGVSEAVGDAGFVVPPRDHVAVADACLTLLRDPQLRADLGRLARQRVLERFTLEQWTDAYRDIYRGVCVDPDDVASTAGRPLPDSFPGPSRPARIEEDN
jgi:glycosyltransferase involved in cell wall biosynthesis